MSEMDNPDRRGERTEPHDSTRLPNLPEGQRLVSEARPVGDASEDTASTDESDEFDHSPVSSSARMVPPQISDDEKAAVDALVQEGISREWAENLVSEHGANWETLKAAAFAADVLAAKED